ncbi:MAG: DUF72 domain-containing protein [Proteobacteria bacterium]|nr:DUF72 domain-containing protein [Pseudomonadota bacterium]
MTGVLRLGTAGWAIPRAVADRFPAEGSGLARYAARFNAAEINGSFYRPHKPQTYARWADTTPPGFRFAVKAPRAVTHEAKLAGGEAAMARFLSEAAWLGGRLGPVLVQLPPSLAFDPAVAEGFFAGLRGMFDGAVVCEPRHPTWFGAEGDALLAAYKVGRVAADPARGEGAGRPGGWDGIRYWRLHGSPRMYFSSYDAAALAALARDLAAEPGTETWCVLDNTASGAAAANALDLAARLGSGLDEAVVELSRERNGRSGRI